MSKIQELAEKAKKRYLTPIGREKGRIRNFPRFKEGHANILGSKFFFHDSASFIDSYVEIFEKEIYKFNPDPSKRTILDCGANIGLSVLYFARNYPTHSIIAFEPDRSIFDILSRNVDSFGLKNVRLVNKAVWKKEEVLEFYTDNGMGARVGHAYENQEPVKVPAVRLRDYLTDDIDFLKIDIEGAEDSVLKDCSDILRKVQKLFFEYHGHYKEPQTLHDLLRILQENDLHYYIKESSTRSRPFVETGLICEVYDMAINIFGYHPANS
jgi:FkbM family methyltransferase